jgi:acid phosphatase
MHDGSVARGDAWLRRHIGPYADWCRTHGSLLIVTFDEDDDTGGDNRIPTVIYGARVKPGRYGERIDDYTLLRTIEAMYGLRPLGVSADRQPITTIWETSGSGQ